MYHFRELQGRYNYINIYSVSVATMKMSYVPFFIQIALPFIILTGIAWLLVVIGFGIGSNDTDDDTM